MKNAVLWLWAQRALGEGAHVNDVLRSFGSVEAFWRAEENDYRKSGLFGKTKSFSKARLPLLTDKDLAPFRRILDVCDNEGILVLTPNDPRYPKRLLALSDLPLALFVKGNPDWLGAQRAYAVIGSRRPEPDALQAATEIADELSDSGCVIVSGGALGIDTAAHKAALKNDCPTVLVLGCGHLTPYLKENASLREEVAAKGVLVSEYAPHTPSSTATFPLRNRLIAGLSDALVIVQAGAKSGTLNTARHAQRLQKTVFVLPGARHDTAFEGSRWLLQNGAFPLFSGADALQKLRAWEQSADALELFDTQFGIPDAAPPLQPQRQQPEAQKAKGAQHEKFTNFDVQSVSNSAAIVYNILQTQPMTSDDLGRSCDLSVSELLCALTELELAGAIERDACAVYACV